MKILAACVVLGCLVASAAARRCVCGAPSGGGTVNVRNCASTSCTVVGSINPGECFDHLATENGWYRITYNGVTAYSSADYLSDPHECGSSGYCAARLCSSFSTNQKRACDSYGCGNYGASRGSSMHGGWDVKCNGGATVYAPYAGVVVRKAYPYGDGTCCDTGFLIDGSGQFAGHSTMIFYCEPDRVSMGATVTKGQAVATHKGLHCGCYGTGMTDHIHYQLSYNGVRIDPASFLFC